MEKKILLKNILIELDQLPEAYLQQWHDLIRSFRKKLPVKKGVATSPTEPDFDWEVLVNEVMNNRRQQNQRQLKSAKEILND